MAFYQCRNITVLGAAQQIAFPVTRNRSVFHFRRSFANRDGIDDLTARLSADGCVSRAAHASLRPQVVHQLFFQYATRLNEEAAVNRLVGHSHARVIGELNFQPSGNLLGRPVPDQFTRNDVTQLAVPGDQTSLRAQGRNPSLAICIMGTIGRTATMASDFPTYCGDRSLQATDRSHESTSRKQFLGRCLLARPDGVLPVSGDGQKEECRREAATQRECNYAASQKRVQSHAASVPPSSESKRHASHSQ